MTETNEPISFGRYLQRIRTEKDVPLEEIAGATKISMHVLSHIEKEEHSQLPSPAVVRGFLRLYADSIGADPDMTINLYRESLEASTQKPSGRGRMGKHLNTWLRFFFFLGVMALLVTGWVYYSSQPMETQSVETGLEPAEPAREPDDRGVADVMPEKVEAPPAAEKAPPKKHKLLIEAVDETWIKLIIDGKKPDEYTLASGDRLELEALANFNILIGNSAGVKLTLDEKPVRLSGKKGQVVTLNLP